MADRSINDALKIVINKQTTERKCGIVIFYELEGPPIEVPLTLIPASLELIKVLEEEGKFLTEESGDAYVILTRVHDDTGLRLNMQTVAIDEQKRDAPACDVCGSITVKSGKEPCFVCLNCGNKMGFA